MKLKLLLIPLLGSSLLLSACSSATSQVISSLSSAQKYFEANKGELNKKNVINILKDGYNSDPNKTVNA
ncbi:lipoprotein, partial [Mycoplasmoides pneumoniae]